MKILMMLKKQIITVALFALVLAGVSAGGYKDTLPDWLRPLREAVYEQKLKAGGVYPIYAKALMFANALRGVERLNYHAWCKYLMGRVYQFDGDEDTAIEYYEAGLEDAEQSLKIKETAEGWRHRAENLSQLCTLKNKFFVMANGLDVGNFSEKALSLDPKDAKAQYMIASRWVYAPSPFSDVPKGISMMKAILNGNYNREKDDLFNLYVSLAYAYNRDDNKSEARSWLNKALGVYPTNKFAGVELRAEISK
jgi:tetratricopeptide (TPR) repeat protein